MRTRGLVADVLDEVRHDERLRRAVEEDGLPNVAGTAYQHLTEIVSPTYVWLVPEQPVELDVGAFAFDSRAYPRLRVGVRLLSRGDVEVVIGTGGDDAANRPDPVELRSHRVVDLARRVKQQAAITQLHDRHPRREIAARVVHRVHRGPNRARHVLGQVAMSRLLLVPHASDCALVRRACNPEHERRARRVHRQRKRCVSPASNARVAPPARD